MKMLELKQIWQNIKDYKIVRKKKDIDFIYASSSINVRENRSNLRETIARISASESYNDAMRIFGESGLDDGSGDFMSSIDKQSAELCDFLRKATDDNSKPIISYMNAGQEVMAVKIAVKTYVFAENGGESDNPEQSRLMAMASKGDFSELENKELADAALDALTQASESRDPQIVDIILDKTLYEYRRGIAKSSGIKYLSDVCKNDIDIKNLCTAFRLKRRKAIPEDVSVFVYEGGEIPVSAICDFVNEAERYAEALDKTEFGAIALKLYKEGNSPASCEKALEDRYYQKLAKVKDDIYGSGKVVAYAILYEKWLCDLRMLLTAKKVGKTV